MLNSAEQRNSFAAVLYLLSFTVICGRYSVQASN